MDPQQEGNQGFEQDAQQNEPIQRVQQKVFKMNLIPYQNLSERTRLNIYENYFSGRKPYMLQEKAFYRYMNQIYDEKKNTSIIVKKLKFTCYKPNSSQQLEEACMFIQLLYKQNIYKIIGSLKELKYLNEQNEKEKVQVCDIINQHLCSIHYEIQLPYISDESQIKLLEQQFNNQFMIKKFEQKLQKLDKDYVIMRDVSESAFSTYQINNGVVKLSKSNFFAFEEFQRLNLIKYFTVRDNNQKYFFEHQKQQQIQKQQEQEFDLVFVVGVQDQSVINLNIIQYCLQEQDELQKLSGLNNPKSILKQAQNQLEQLTNAIRIKIISCCFEVILHPNTSNIYSLKQDNNLEDFLQDYAQQVEEYEIILQQLKYENDAWLFNLNNKYITFYNQVDRYPEFFYLKQGQTVVAKCRNANIKIENINITEYDLEQLQYH